MTDEVKNMNRDPITNAPGSHPVGTGIGAVTGGAVAGAAAGAFGGPVGAVVGGAIGAVVGGLTGKAAAESINPTAEEAYWRDNYNRESYYEEGRDFDDYAPAYRLGLTGRTRYPADWDSAEPHLAAEWESARASSTLGWPQAQHASRAAWDRVDNIRSASAASMVGSAQSAGNFDGDTDDVIDVLDDLAECCKDGEFGFRACAEQADSADLKTMFMECADRCRQSAQELYEQINSLGGTPDEGGSTAGALHRGWVAVKASLTSYDDKAVLEECERGEDNALARYRKAMEHPLPANIQQMVNRQLDGVQRNHDRIKRLRDLHREAANAR